MTQFFEKTYDASLTSMAKRLRLKDYQQPNSLPLKRPVRLPKDKEQVDGTTVESLELQKIRLRAMGGDAQQERMIYDKRKALDMALLYSYQGANILKVREPSKDFLDSIPVRALINPNKLKQDYDDKIISVSYEANFKPGDIFEWLGTGTHWIIYLQDLTELAYFRGDIRRCRYEISWKDNEGIHSTYAAIRGPVETKINFIQKHTISVDEPNYSLNLLMPQTPEVLAYFKRYSKFYLKDSDICWRVEAVDWVSTPGILEVTAVEYYANEFEDSNSIAGNLVIEEKEPNTVLENAAISGETFIKPKLEYTYVTPSKENSNWSINSKCPVQLIVSKDNPKECKIKWIRPISGQFELSYGKYSKTIVVESLF